MVKQYSEKYPLGFNNPSCMFSEIVQCDKSLWKLSDDICTLKVHSYSLFSSACCHGDICNYAYVSTYSLLLVAVVTYFLDRDRD